ncbi:hypothetical protein AVEN_66540-1 [Araneus ventricosus]|uniref:Uncharacterized protein n=1 Tax=Araneus ventricosus TaxID=182803 RepID=A0A4Y2EBL1_ARAVE|nr:hypothetical protein AVEN_66540-1 [Araneus ventricosus]
MTSNAQRVQKRRAERNRRTANRGLSDMAQADVRDEITIARWRTCIIVDLISINARWWGNITTGGGVSISRDGDSHELEPDGGVLEHYSTPNQNPNFFQNPKSEFLNPNSQFVFPIRIPMVPNSQFPSIPNSSQIQYSQFSSNSNSRSFYPNSVPKFPIPNSDSQIPNSQFGFPNSQFGFPNYVRMEVWWYNANF